MKNGILILLISLTTSIYTIAQRYLTNVFPEIDSIIGGTYGSAINVQSQNQELLFDYYEPSGDSETSRPLLIYIHGGGFNTGTRDYLSVKLLCREMAHKGYTVATISYRLDPEFEFYNSNTDRRAMTDAMHDAKQAIRYFKTNADLYGIDTTRVFIGGESAGAVTAMMASYIDKQEEMVPYPMAHPNDPIGSDNNLEHSNEVTGTLCLCGTILDTLAMESPADPPILWIHGTEDSFVPISFAFTVVLRALNVGIPIETKLYQGGIHCPWFYGNPNWETYLDSTISAISSFLYPKVVSTETEDERSIMKANIYPNPTSGIVTVLLDRIYIEIKMTLLSIDGKNIRQNSHQEQRQITSDISNLSPGIYFIKLENQREILIRKIIKYD